MAQITFYVPDNVAQQIRSAARRARKSLSRYLADLATGADRPAKWPKWFFELQGSWEGPLQRPEDPPPDEPESL